MGLDISFPKSSSGSRVEDVSKFNLPAAVRLAAFAFSIYGDPEGTRWYRTPDGTLTGRIP